MLCNVTACGGRPRGRIRAALPLVAWVPAGVQRPCRVRKLVRDVTLPLAFLKMRRVTLLETYFRRRFLPTGQHKNKTILQKMRSTHQRHSIDFRPPSLSLVELPLPAHTTSPNGHRVSVHSKEGRIGRNKERGSARAQPAPRFYYELVEE